MYVLAEIIPESCQKLGPYATATEASNVPCPAGTYFHSYTEEGERTAKICCPIPPELRPVASVNAPSEPTTPLDCPRGSYFIRDTDGTNKCVYCFRVPGGAPCPGIPGIGRYKPTTPTTSPTPPTASPTTTPVPLPVVQTPVVKVTATTPTIGTWVQANWKWLAAIAAVGGAAYYLSRRKTALS